MFFSETMCYICGSDEGFSKSEVCRECKSLVRSSDIMRTITAYFSNGMSFEKCMEQLKGFKILNISDDEALHQCFEGFENYTNTPVNDDFRCLSEGQYDIIISKDAPEYLPNPRKLFQEAAGALCPGGAHIFTVEVDKGLKKSKFEGIGSGGKVTRFGSDIKAFSSVGGTTTVSYEWSSEKRIVYMQKKPSQELMFDGERAVPKQTEEELWIEHEIRYLFAGQFVSGKRVLDAACGAAYGSEILSETALGVCGIDISEAAINYARFNYSKENTLFLTASVDDMPFPAQSFDVAVSFETLEHLDESAQTAFINEIKRVLTPNGIMVMSTPNKSYYKNHDNEFHMHELGYDEFYEMLLSCFCNVVTLPQNYEIGNIISSPESNGGKYDGNMQANESEYMIAVCSDFEIPPIVSQICARQSGRLNNLTEWAVSNHETNESLNKHIEKLNNEIDMASIHKELRQDTYDALQKIGQAYRNLLSGNELSLNLEYRVTSLTEKNRQMASDLENEKQEHKEVAEKLHDAETLNQNQKAHIEQLIVSERQLETQNQNQKAHIEQLIVSERQLAAQNQNQKAHIEQLIVSERHLKGTLDAVYASRSWRFMGVARKAAGVIIPFGSRRRLFAGILFFPVRHPVRFLRKLTPGKISSFFKVMRTEGLHGVSRRLKAHKHKDGGTCVEVDAPNTKDMPATEYEPLVFKAESNPKVSIIVPVYNQFDVTYKCLRAVLKNTHGVSYEVIVADDCSSDFTTEIESVVKNVRTITAHTNLRFLKNCNNAAQHASGEYVLFLNNDTQVQDNWLLPMTELMEKDADTGIVGAKLVYPDGSLQEAGGILWRDGSAWNYGRMSDPERAEYNYVKEADYVSGAALMVRKNVWDELGGFDPLFSPAYCEDSDLCFSARKLGYKVLYQPKSVVVHFEGLSHGVDTSAGQKQYQLSNQEKLFEKWRHVLENHYPNGENVFNARDRSGGKKTFLVIDHYVPHYDKDAGSKTTFQYIKLFLSLGFNVKFIGDNFCIHEPYTGALTQMGVEVLYGQWYESHWKTWLKENGAFIDYVFLNRPHVAEKYINHIKNLSSAKIFYYGHDLHFLRERRLYDLTGDVRDLKSSDNWFKREMKIINTADVVYYPSNIEVDEILKNDAGVNAKSIPAYIFANTADTRDFSQTRDIMFVGGFNHPPNIDGVIWYAKEILPRVIKKMLEIKTYIIGSNMPESIKELSSEHLITTGFVSEEELEAFYSNCRLSVVPLRYGAGVKGKVVEAMSRLMPVVTTSVGAEGIDGKCLFIKDDASDFADEIIRVYENVSLLSEMANRQAEVIASDFSPGAAISIIKSDFNL